MKANILQNLLYTTVFLLTGIGLSGQSLARIWETSPEFDKPESAVFDPQNQAIYVSNICGQYSTRDGNGFISKVDMNGKILDLKWITGLNSPQGLALHDNFLYVADMDEVVRIDIRAAKIDTIFRSENAIFLNDAASDQFGNVYISDCRANRIYKLAGDHLSVWLNGAFLNGVNGLLCQGDKFFVLNMGIGDIYRVDTKTMESDIFCSGIKNCDGIVPDGKDGYFVSGAWQGEIYHLDCEGQKNLVLDLSPEKVVTADIGFIPGENILLIPTLNKTLMAYQFKW